MKSALCDILKTVQGAAELRDFGQYQVLFLAVLEFQALSYQLDI